MLILNELDELARPHWEDVRDVARSSSATEQFGTLLFRLGMSEKLPCDLKALGELDPTSAHVAKASEGPVSACMPSTKTIRLMASQTKATSVQSSWRKIEAAPSLQNRGRHRGT